MKIKKLNEIIIVINKYVIEKNKLNNIHYICILCWGRIGDVFFRVPVIEVVKQQYPNSKIYVVVDPCGYEILQNHPDVQETVVVDRTKKPRLNYIKEIYTKSKKLRRLNIDLCINLYSGGFSATFSRLINAKIRLGFDHTKALRKFNTLLVKYPGFCQHWAYCLGIMLKPIGIEVEKVRLGSSFFTTQKSLDKADFILNNTSKYVVYNLGTGSIDKNWPVTSFAELANKIYSEYGLKPIILVNPGMQELAEDFHRQCESSILMPILTFDEIAAVLIKTGLLITGDTSIMHLAFGVKVANLVIFTKTRPEIVKPVDCIHEACFIENKDDINECGTANGIFDIPVNYAFECFQKLKLRVDNESVN